MEEFVAGAIGGASGLLVGHPLEVMKVQQQVSGKGLRQAAVAAFDRGLRQGIYRGLSFPLASFTAINAVFFGCYSNCLYQLEEANVGSHEGRVFLAGMAGGAAQLPLLTPVELVKTAMQAQVGLAAAEPGGDRLLVSTDTKFYSGPVECAKSIVRRHGYTGLFKGFAITFARDVPSYGLYMLAYELLYRRLAASYDETVGQLVAGGVAGSLCWLSIMPIDVLKSNIQAGAVLGSAGRPSVRTAVLEVYRKSGLAGFFRGASAVALRAFPANAVTFFAWSRSLEAMRPN